MEVTEIPFNHFLGIKKAGDEAYLLELGSSGEYLNHLGNVHASAQLALAEASSGEFLMRSFKDTAGQVIPVVRRMESKFRKPASGAIYSKARIQQEMLDKFTSELETKGRALISVEVDIFDANKILTMTTLVEWYVQKIK